MASVPQKILITGITGQVGQALLEIVASEQVLACSRAELDISQPETVYESLVRLSEQENFAGIVNPAAFTAVDLAEKERDLAFACNADSPREMARFCAERGLPFLHFSTDYVFNGSGDLPWKETDAVDPINAYGASKLKGEQLIADEFARAWDTKGKALAGGAQVKSGYAVVRTSWVYDHQGKNFLNTMLRLGSEREKLSVVADQIGAPTYALELGRGSMKIFDALRQSPDLSGIVHLAGGGETSWHGFAETIFLEAKNSGVPLRVHEVCAINSEQYPTPAQRPKNSRLEQSRALERFSVRMPHWQQSLRDCLKRKYANQ